MKHLGKQLGITVGSSGGFTSLSVCSVMKVARFLVRHWLKVWELECSTVGCREQIWTPVKFGRWHKRDKGRYQIYCRKRRRNLAIAMGWLLQFLFKFSQRYSPSHFMWYPVGCSRLWIHPGLISGVTSMFKKASATIWSSLNPTSLLRDGACQSSFVSM